MGLNKVKATSNMYQFLNDNGGHGYTWNVIKGKCPHDCSYCYMKRYPQPELHFDEKELKTDLGSGNTIFVGSSCDMWADFIPMNWIEKVIRHCLRLNLNKYLFQTKNPGRFLELGDFLPDKVLLGCTVESNQNHDFISLAPKMEERYECMSELIYPTMISIEPIMDFDLDVMVRWMQEIKPVFVSIGADSGNNHLPEPEPQKIEHLIKALQGFTKVKIKDNLKRLQ